MTAENRTPDVTIRLAREGDLAAIVEIIAADEAGLHADGFDDGNATRYKAAFRAIDDDPRNELYVAEADGAVIGTTQATFIPYIFDGGCERALVETMFVAPAWRGRGVGGLLLDYACDRARARGSAMVQLTSNRKREDAHRFYARHGFAATHLGFKRDLT